MTAEIENSKIWEDNKDAVRTYRRECLSSYHNYGVKYVTKGQKFNNEINDSHYQSTKLKQINGEKPKKFLFSSICKQIWLHNII